MQNPVTTVTDKISQRPAESSTVAGAAAIVIARIFGLTDPDVLVSLTVLLAFVPTAVTWLVETLRTWKAKAP